MCLYPHEYEKLLTHWGRVTHICVSKVTIIGSDNDLSPGRRQAIIWTNAGILLIGPLGTNFSEILFEIYTFSLMKMHLKMSSGKWRPSCLGLNVLNKFSYEVASALLIATWIKCPPVCRNFKMLFLEWKYWYLGHNFIAVCSLSAIHKQSWMVKVIAWHRILPDPMITTVLDAIWCH